MFFRRFSIFSTYLGQKRQFTNNDANVKDVLLGRNAGLTGQSYERSITKAAGAQTLGTSV